MSTPDVPSIRLLADYILKSGSGVVFIACTVALLLIYFVKLIFKKPSNETRLEEIRDLLIEAKHKLDQLLKKE